MKLAVLFSGGKDSTLAMYKAMKYNEIVCLISMISENDASYMFHVPNIHITKLQAEALDLPLIEYKTKGVKEEELEDLKKAIQKAKDMYKIEGVVTGALRSKYQESRIAKLCEELNLRCINPLWLANQVEVLKEVVGLGFEVIISGVFAYPFDEKLLGKVIDKDVVTLLTEMGEKYKINPAGEGGEIETTVLNAPFFKKKIKILESETNYKNNAGTFIIKKAELIESS